MPGRVRASVEGIKGRSDMSGSLEMLMRCYPGIRQVEANPITGNVLVRFDDTETSSEAILLAMEEIGIPDTAADVEPQYSTASFSKQTPMLRSPDVTACVRDRLNAGDNGTLYKIGFRIGTVLAKALLKQALKKTGAEIIIDLL
jgi:copper chaperone CopZ